MSRYTVTRCSCGEMRGINGNDIHGPSPRTASDLTRDIPVGAGTAESRVGRRPGRRAPQPVGTLPVSEGRLKALSTTG